MRFGAAVQVSRCHVPPFAAWCLMPYVFIYTFISMFLHGGDKTPVLVDDNVLVIFFIP
jgi:hypothetical protein